MSLFTSSQFASAAASGKDWREVSKAVITELEKAQDTENKHNIGFLYISDLLVEDASSILNLMRSVLNIDHWVGAVGIGVCGQGEGFIDKPAISVMVGHIDPENFCVFQEPGAENLKHWLKEKDPMMVLIHGDPISEQDPGIALKDLDSEINGFFMGGLSSSRTEHIQYADDLAQSDLSGVAFSQDVLVASALSQGCAPIGPIHTITRGDGHIIREIDDTKASEVFEADLHQMARKKLGKDPNEIVIEEAQLYEDDPVPEEFQPLFKGEIHVAFPVSQSDQKDYLVRNIIGVDPDEGAIAVSETVSNAESIIFVHRDDETVISDLKTHITALRQRVEKDTGAFKPKGALYISCVARGFSKESNGGDNEMSLIKDIIGDIPLAGFYAGGEINNARLYGYTGILTLFL